MPNNISNVRFYKLETLPSFDAAKHTGVFVHVTATLTRTPVDDKTFKYTWGGIDTEKIAALRITKTETVAQWMENRRLNTVASGLWFGGAAGWELLSNEISGGFAENGALKVGASGRESSIFTANQANDTTVTLGTGLSLTTGESGAGNNYILNVDLSGIAGAMHYIGAIANDAAWPSTTPAKGDVYISTGTFTHTPSGGTGTDIEPGDMIVFGDSGAFTVVQSNIKLGVGQGQVATNSAALTSGNIVVASATGIETISFDATNLTDTSNKNTRSYSAAPTNQDASVTGLYHGALVTDTFKIMNRDMNSSLTIASQNRSFSIEGSGSAQVSLDLIWNTVME